MSEFLGKTNFSQGLTTHKRGVYGNNAVLNVCHGFDISDGSLVPVTSVGNIVSSGNITGYDENNDYVVEYKDKYYSFYDFTQELWDGNLKVTDYFGTLKLMGKPCISDGLIVYPTDKGLFAYEPEAKGNVKKVRYLSFMSPDDYDKYNDKESNGYDTHHLKVHNQPVEMSMVFNGNVNSYTKTNCTCNVIQKNNHNQILQVKCSDSGLIRENYPDGYFEIKKDWTFDENDWTKSWFIYDIRIENDNQEYAVDRPMFENGDATPSGYEIVFGKTESNKDINVCVLGIPKLEFVNDRWYKCASYLDMTQEEIESIEWVKLRTSDFFYTSRGDNPIISIGIENKSVADPNDKWKFIGNYLFPYAQANDNSTFKDLLKRSQDNTIETSKTDNEFPDPNLEQGLMQMMTDDDGKPHANKGWLPSHFRPSYTNSITKRNGEVVSQTFTSCLEFEWNSWFWMDNIPISPMATYDFSCVCYSDDGRFKGSIYITFSDKSGKTRTVKCYDENEQLHNVKREIKNIFTGNNTTCKIEFGTARDRLDISGGDDGYIFGFMLVKVSDNTFYKTSRTLYSYTLSDLYDPNKIIHNTKKYSYSFCGRNKFDNYNIDLSKDRYDLMVSNASEDSVEVGDNPFSDTIIEIDYLPVKDINGTERNVLSVYHDYFTDILLYKSVIYGNTNIQEDFTFCGKINKSWTSADSGRKRFKNNYMTTHGFIAVDDSPLEKDSDKDTYYDIDKYHYVDPQQEIYNDFLEQANCVCHLNGRLYAGNIGYYNNKDLQPTAIAVSNYNQNWIFPTSVDDGSVTGTGTQTDNLHSISNKLVALASVGDRMILFYDKEILSMYGNDFYSSNGFGTQNIGRLSCREKSIANTIREVIFSDGKDWYITNGGVCQNISKYKIEQPNSQMNKTSAMFYDNKYFIVGDTSNKIYVYDLFNNAWWTFDKQNIVQLIDYPTKAMCVIKTGEDTYSVAELFGDTYSGEKRVETMYQIISSTQHDVIINDFAIDCNTAKNNEVLCISMFSQGEYKEGWCKELRLEQNKFRYNKSVRFNKAVSAVKQVVVYKGENPPTIYSIGVIRNDFKTRE